MDEEERSARQMIEPLSELRVAVPGVQVLVAFLLTVAFTSRFAQLNDFQREVFMLTLLTATLSTTCLIAPSAAHRLRFHQADREWLIESANAWMLSGLVLLALALSGVDLHRRSRFGAPFRLVYPSGATQGAAGSPSAGSA
jgi:hypothetical protein